MRSWQVRPTVLLRVRDGDACRPLAPENAAGFLFRELHELAHARVRRVCFLTEDADRELPSNFAENSHSVDLLAVRDNESGGPEVLLGQLVRMLEEGRRVSAVQRDPPGACRSSAGVSERCQIRIGLQPLEGTLEPGLDSRIQKPVGLELLDLLEFSQQLTARRHNKHTGLRAQLSKAPGDRGQEASGDLAGSRIGSGARHEYRIDAPEFPEEGDRLVARRCKVEQGSAARNRARE